MKLGLVAHTCNTTLRRQRQEDHKFKASLGYATKFCLRGISVVLKYIHNTLIFDNDILN